MRDKKGELSGEQNDAQNTKPSLFIIGSHSSLGQFVLFFFAMYNAEEIIYDFPWLVEIKTAVV